MFKCKKCDVEMDRVYCFETNEPYRQFMKCPVCGFQTKPQPIVFNEHGEIIMNNRKNSKRKKEKTE